MVIMCGRQETHMAHERTCLIKVSDAGNGMSICLYCASKLLLPALLSCMYTWPPGLAHPPPDIRPPDITSVATTSYT